MPAVYEKCVNTKGSKKFTKKLSGGKYVHGCRLPGSEKATWGEVHQGKKKKAGYKRKVDSKMRSFGEIDFEKKSIRINPKKGEVLNTIVHEEVHRRYPDKSERWVKKRATKEEKSLTLGDAMKLMKKYQRRQNG